MRIRDVPYKWIVAAVFVTGLFMDIMDTTIVNTAVPALAKDLHATPATIEWVILGYLLSLAAWIPASGWIGDRFGTKKTFLFALGIFTGGSALCGLATTPHQLIAFRVLQGIGGGMLTPVGTTMLYRAFPPEERAKASSILMIPAIIAPAVGPVVGGWLVTNASWRWIFFINVPIGIAGFIFGAAYLREHKEPTAGSIDIPGFIMSGASLALLLYALSQGPGSGWRSTEVLATGFGGLVLAVALVMHELRTAFPLLDLRLYRERMFRNATLIMSISFGGMAGTLFILPQFLQNVRGLTAFQSGLTTFPQAVGMLLCIRLVGARLYPRVGPRRLVIVGMVGVALVSAAFVNVDTTTSLWWIRLLMVLRGVSTAFAFIPLQAAAYANISTADTGRASALFSTQRQVGAALGVAILATVWFSRNRTLVATASSKAARLAASVGAFHDAFLTAAVIAFVSAGLGLLVRDADATSTRPGR